MALSTVRQANFTPALNRIEVAQRALFQIEALLPIAQRLADASGDAPDAMLGLLGRIAQMNNCVMLLLADVVAGIDSEESLKSAAAEILGRREVSHVS